MSRATTAAFHSKLTEESSLLPAPGRFPGDHGHRLRSHYWSVSQGGGAASVTTAHNVIKCVLPVHFTRARTPPHQSEPEDKRHSHKLFNLLAFCRRLSPPALVSVATRVSTTEPQSKGLLICHTCSSIARYFTLFLAVAAQMTASRARSGCLTDKGVCGSPSPLLTNSLVNDFCMFNFLCAGKMSTRQNVNRVSAVLTSSFPEENGGKKQ